jgi:hypothetical protein
MERHPMKSQFPLCHVVKSKGHGAAYAHSGKWLRAAALVIGLTILLPDTGFGAAGATKYVILLTSDGLRWQELFTGADQRLIDPEAGGVKQPDELRKKYWHEDAAIRRQRLMPFFWSTIAARGQVFGAPEAESRAVVTNRQNFSYPGYQELLCGFPDSAIDSNDKIDNANVSVLEWLNNQQGLQRKVAAFAAWDCFPYILNVRRSGLFVNAGWQPIDHATDPSVLPLLNRIAEELPHFAPDARLDALTGFGAMQYLETQQPHVFYIAFDETDAWCHAGRYDLYLDAAHHFDHFVQTLWQWIAQSEKYAGKTSIILTTDHGRGDTRDGWKSHGSDLPGSEQIWIAVMGPDTSPMGLRRGENVTQGQVAATVAALLGFDYTAADSRIAPPLAGASGGEQPPTPK